MDKPEDEPRADADRAATSDDDARFEDSFEPIRLIARSTDDLAVLSALLQDAVVAPKDLAYDRPRRRFALLANRFRWERRDFRERVRVAAHFDAVLSVRSRGAPLRDGDTPLSILSVAFEPDGEPPSGVVRIACAGGAEFELRVEALEAVASDVSKPWPAAATPSHFGV